MMKGFILKLIRLEVRLKRKTLMQRKHQKTAQEMLDQANFLMIQSHSRVEQEQKDMETLLGTFTESIEDQQCLNFSQDNNVVRSKKRNETQK